ncbi:MAG: diphthine--ammonia ligase [Candidatus Lokiarchaeota archaeon]|nr:diphthine--ammonia ligase [Candidatus Lokiarchaeota archaeon]
MRPVIVSWSGGKDSALALYEILASTKYEVKTLFTTLSIEYERVSMHGIRKELLLKQTKSLSLHLRIISLPKDTSNATYANIMKKEMSIYKSQGIEYVAFGDIFLEDIRSYREENLKKLNMEAVFPLWGKDSLKLAHKFINLGFKAIVTSIDIKYLPKTFVGKNFNEDFLNNLPKNVDPCGENGEFHTFVYDGPLFSFPIRFQSGKTVLRDQRFYFLDLIF